MPFSFGAGDVHPTRDDVARERCRLSGGFTSHLSCKTFLCRDIWVIGDTPLDVHARGPSLSSRRGHRLALVDELALAIPICYSPTFSAEAFCPNWSEARSEYRKPGALSPRPGPCAA